MKPLIWKGSPPDLIYCEPDRKSSMKIEVMEKGYIWYAVRVGESTFDSFFGNTAKTIDEAKTICETVYKAFKNGEKFPLRIHNPLP